VLLFLSLWGTQRPKSRGGVASGGRTKIKNNFGNERKCTTIVISIRYRRGTYFLHEKLVKICAINRPTSDICRFAIVQKSSSYEPETFGWNCLGNAFYYSNIIFRFIRQRTEIIELYVRRISYIFSRAETLIFDVVVT